MNGKPWEKMSARARNILRKEGLCDIEKLAAKSIIELEGVRNCGKTVIEELRGVLEFYGHTFADERPLEEPTPPPKPACETCLFFQLCDGRYGVCRRFPPSNVIGNSHEFPIIRQDDWCGEYQPKGASN